MRSPVAQSGIHLQPLQRSIIEFTPRHAPTRIAAQRLSLAPARAASHFHLTLQARCYSQPPPLRDSQVTHSTMSVQRRKLHSSDPRTNTVAEPPQISETLSDGTTNMAGSSAPLSMLPLAMILRSLATTAVSSSPALLPPSLRIMALLAHTTNPILNPDRNPLLKMFLKHTFYAQFCAGENSSEVKQSIAKLKDIGFTGVILGYAKEVVLSNEETASLNSGVCVEETEADIMGEIKPWAEGTLKTVDLAGPGDFVALKFTGAGRLALYQLKHRLPASPYLAKSIDEICQRAQIRGVRLLFDAEQDALQDGIDDWTLASAIKYNKTADTATVYGTYQAYKKCTPAVISSHLAIAQKENFTLGVKLVRGAYLGSDPRDKFHDTKEDTDACYNSVAASVLTRNWSPVVEGDGDYPSSCLVLATHNLESVRRASAICDAGGAKSDIAFAQLQGMADEVSCELVSASKDTQAKSEAIKWPLPVFKYMVWGTTGECMKYLHRRAQENKDAVQRTISGRDAMWAEVVRRCKSVVGLA